MPPNTHEGLKDYRKYLRRKSQTFCCVYCGIPVFAKDYENHCSRYHDLNSKSCCTWCCGTKSWRSGEKHRHVDHLTACFNRFYNARQNLTYPRPINWSPTCPEVESFFNHSTSIRQLIPLRAFQSIWPPEDLPAPPITFQTENLNLAASYLQMYLETRDTHDWLHLMVKAVTMESFLHALDFDDGGTRILEFWCWCDGGRDREDALRQHRHMIAVSEGPKDRFKQEVWPRVRVQPSPRPNFPSKRFKKIESPIHLINALGYLSQRRSKCNFTRKPDPGPPRDNHFYIFKTLPKGYKLPLSALCPGGVLKLLEQEKFQKISIPRFIENPLTRNTRNKWQQKIKYFKGLERGIVIPVEKRFAPTTETTPNYLYLTENRKLYFEPNPENESLNQAAWLQMQFEGGNTFYDAVGEETWIPRKTDQSRINDMMLLVKKIETLESYNRYLKTETEELKSENEELRNDRDELSEENEELEKEKNELTKENKELRNELGKLNKENEELKNELCKENELIKELKNKNNELTEENKTLKRKYEQENEKYIELCCKLNNVYEKQIVRLEIENRKFRKLMEQCTNCQQKLQE